jgi:hypothetical protein
LLSQRILEHRQAFRETGFWKRFPLEDVERDVLIAESVDAVLESLKKIIICISRINESEAPSGAALRPSKA